MSARGRAVTGLAVVLASLAGGVAPAGAATIVGSTLAGEPDLPFPAFPQGNLQLGYTQWLLNPTVGNPNPQTPPADGTIVSIRLKHSANPTGTLGWRIVDGTIPTVSTRTDVRLPDFTLPAGVPAGISTFIPTDGEKPHGVPIAAGEHLGLAALTENCCFIDDTNDNDPSQPVANLAGSLASNTVGPQSTQAIGANDRDLLLQYTVEPDADHDGFGDETQDPCPTTFGDCSGQTTQTVTVTPDRATSQACIDAKAAEAKAQDALKSAQAKLKKAKSPAAKRRAKKAVAKAKQALAVATARREGACT